MSLVRSLSLAAVVATFVASCGAAALEPVTGFGSNPGNLKMFEHVPGVDGPLPLVLVLHGCTQDRGYAQQVGLVDLADELGVALVVAETSSGNNQNRCFNWFEPGDNRRGAGEALSLKQMVDAMKARHDIDADRVFVTGLSAGAAMTAVMLATYPDVFSAGAIVAGIPYGCAAGLVDGFTCMSSGSPRSPAAWASLVTAQAPGPYPRVSVWQGDSDFTVRPVNADQLVAQWTAVHGIDQTPTTTASLGSATRKTFGGTNGLPLVESVRIPGMSHGTPVDPGAQCGTAGAFVLDVNLCSSREIFRFFGLLDAAPPDVLPPDDEPGDDEPGDDEPGDDEPGDDEPGDDEPGDDEPGDVPVADVETFSDLDGDGDGFDLEGWSGAPVVVGAAQLVATSSSFASCGQGPVTVTLTRAIDVAPGAHLSFDRTVSLDARINTLTSAGVRVTIDGTVVDEVAVTFGARNLPTESVDVDLAPFAGRNRTLRFEATASSNVCLPATAFARIDNVGLSEPLSALDAAGEGDDDDDDGPRGCTSAGSAPTAGTLLALAGLMLRRRRR